MAHMKSTSLIKDYLESWMSNEFKHSVALTGDTIVDNGEGIPFSWETLAEVFSVALLKEGHMFEEEEIYQIDMNEDGINLVMRNK
jgi:hypothetical protein